MSGNTICLRIFFALALLFVAASIVILYGSRIVTPFVLAWFPSKATWATYASSRVWMSAQPTGEQRLYRSQITYDGVTSTLISTTASTEMEPIDGRPKPNALEHFPLRASRVEIFPVRYSKAFPSIVAREMPNAGIATWFADTWVPGDLPMLIVQLLFLWVLLFSLRRHLRNGRPLPMRAGRS